MYGGGCGGGYEWLHREHKSDEVGEAIVILFFLIFFVLPVIAQFLE